MTSETLKSEFDRLQAAAGDAGQRLEALKEQRRAALAPDKLLADLPAATARAAELQGLIDATAEARQQLAAAAEQRRREWQARQDWERRAALRV